MQRLNINITAIFLIIAFTQKLGLGLYLHNWLHDNKNYYSYIDKGAGINKHQVKCTCIDDALMPLTLSGNLCEIKPLDKYFTSFINCHHSFIPSSAKIFYALRGPPYGMR